jgi:hypothetical protein
MRPDCTMKLPIVPGVGMFLSECKFTIWESKNQLDKSRFTQVVPRGIDLTYSSVVADRDSYNDNDNDIDIDNDNEISDIDSDIVSNGPTTNSGGGSGGGGGGGVPNGIKHGLGKSNTQVKGKTIEKDPAVERINQWRRNIKTHIAKQMTLIGNDWVQELRNNSLLCASRMSRIKSLRNRDLTSADSASAIQSLSPCPTAYERVLCLLRQADKSGNWPDTSLNRKRVINDESTKDNMGGSFTVGALPTHMAQPKGNQLFPDLMRACFDLERELFPHRLGSGTIAINRHAQFKPHRDSGAGNGQVGG